MRFVSTSIAAAAFAVMSSGFASAAVTPADVLAPVLDSCPITVTTGCAAAVRDFIDSRPADADLDDELVDLVSALVPRATHPSATLPACIEIRDGIRAAADAVSLPAPRAKLFEIAAELCDGDDEPGGGGGPVVVMIR